MDLLMETRFFAQRINFNINNTQFTRRNDLVIAIIGPFTFLYNDEKKEIFATTSENVKRFGTLVESRVPITHLNLMDAFVYFLSQIVFNESGYKLAQTLAPTTLPILLAREFHETVLRKIKCDEGSDIRSTFSDLLWVSSTSCNEEDLSKLYLKLKIEVDGYHRILNAQPVMDATVYTVQQGEKKEDNTEVFVRF